MSRQYQSTAISLHPELLARAKSRAAKLGFATSFSAYVAKLISEDLASRAEADKPDSVAIMAAADEAIARAMDRAIGVRKRKGGQKPKGES